MSGSAFRGVATGRRGENSHTRQGCGSQQTSHGYRSCCARIEAWPRISPTYSRACRRSADRALPLARRASEKARPIMLPCRHRTVACTSRFMEFDFIRNVDRVKDHYPRALIRIVADDARQRIATVIEVDDARQISRVTCRSTTLVIVVSASERPSLDTCAHRCCRLLSNCVQNLRDFAGARRRTALPLQPRRARNSLPVSGCVLGSTG